MILNIFFLAGINCYDKLKKEFFLLRAHVLSWSGDTPGLTKLMCLTGHNSYKGCRFCDIRGIYMNHIYFPTKPPITKENQYQTYDPKNLPLRTHEQFRDRIFRINTASSTNEKAGLISEFGTFLFFIYVLLSIASN